MSDQSISLNKYISSTGMCSRREADKLIEAGRVKINKTVAKKGNRVLPKDKVFIDNKLIKKKPRAVYIAFNKPPGITCTTDLRERDNIISYINHPLRIFPIGRLDKASSGLILLTNDGDIVNTVLREENNHEKEYVVTVNKPITKAFLARMSKGLPILGTKTKPCKVKQTGQKSFSIILTQGLNRQIRRMCEFLDYKVVTLKRVRFMHLTLDSIKMGDWRNLDHNEIAALKK